MTRQKIDMRARGWINVHNSELALWRAAAAVVGRAGALSGFIRDAVHAHALRIMLAVERRPLRLRAGARIWKLRNGTVEVWAEATGLERAWPVQEVGDAPFEVSATRRALQVDVVAPGGEGLFVDYDDVRWPADVCSEPTRKNLHSNPSSDASQVAAGSPVVEV